MELHYFLQSGYIRVVFDHDDIIFSHTTNLSLWKRAQRTFFIAQFPARGKLVYVLFEDLFWKVPLREGLLAIVFSCSKLYYIYKYTIFLTHLMG